MPALDVRHITKTFGSTRAVDDVSFSVEPGEIFGLLGPNGAGKTTSIRIILDIFKADRGSVDVFGGPIDERKKDQIGYMPEERGLYQDINLERCMLYLASLKNLDPDEARRRINEYMERFDLSAHRQKKLKELSKGMQQKAQLIVTLVHQPKLVIIDEPFAALDPVNTQMVKDILNEQRSQGVAIVMCTHQMHQVEELCDRLVLIDHGRSVLYGELEEIRHRFAEQDLLVKSTGPLPASLPGVLRIEPHNNASRVKIAPGFTTQDVLRSLIDRGICLESFEIAMPTLDEIFIKVVQGQGDGMGARA